MKYLFLAATLVSAPLGAQGAYAPSADNLAARQWFRDAKLGLFIHWGVYSQLAEGEWVMQNRHIGVPQYEWLASQFNPVHYDAAAWVALAKAAGARYITITSRHHDGFAMFDSKASDYNIVARTAYGRDVLKPLAQECTRQGLKLFFYYSQLDWHHPDYFPRGGTGRYAGRPDSGQWSRYLDFMNAQLAELLTNYGPLGGIWFDGMWDKPDADWRLDATYSLIHRLQPRALVISNHHRLPFPGEDVQTFEQDLPGQNTAGFNTTEISALPLETAATTNESWGFNLTDREFKSVPQLVGLLVRAAGNDANLLLNIGPRPDGTIQPEFVDRLHALGQWLDRYGESIYGTRGGPIAPRPWGVTTQAGNRVYVHVLDWRDPSLALPPLARRVLRARLLATGTVVPVTQSRSGVVLVLPPRAPEDADQVIVLELEPP